MAQAIITIDAYQAALRGRFLRLAGRRSLTVLAREMRVARNTLSAWVAGRGEHQATVRTLRKIEAWCAAQEAS
jgi:transcriptional regulator with XRE-family HTH domain